MRDSLKKLAKITSAKLEIKERGILNFWIYVDYEDCGSKGIGGVALDQWDKEKDKRVGTAKLAMKNKCLIVYSLYFVLALVNFK